MPSVDVAFRVWHPTLHADAIAKEIGLASEIGWSVGTLRRTPKGTLLDGTRSDTYCCFPVAVPSRDVMSAIEAFVTTRLANRKRFLRSLVASGGRSQLYVTWGGSSNVGADWHWTCLQSLAELRVNLAVEWFPPDRLDGEPPARR